MLNGFFRALKSAQRRIAIAAELKLVQVDYFQAGCSRSEQETRMTADMQSSRCEPLLEFRSHPSVYATSLGRLTEI